ncbi:hypothetical protein COLO4_08832 [Corchorus olitorius]|uniref:Uncharacterized protein n=1 Tax=Corchorus olitorius TaxID=93759 RepID=A0A1R3KED9_9ROSI|nr:hypothetical protein COLO4_08832 [Corchorus olitorius]
MEFAEKIGEEKPGQMETKKTIMKLEEMLVEA